MAQGVAIVFFNNPVEGDSITYSAEINGVKIVYNNGLDTVSFEFTNNDAEVLADPLHRVKIGINEEQTALNVKAFLDNNGFNSVSVPVFTQVILGNVAWYVEVTFQANDKITNLNIDSNSVNVGITGFNVSEVPTTALKYFFEYKNIANDIYRCEIYQKRFIGFATEIIGRATIEKGEAKNHFDSIRGTGLSLEIEANEDLNFEDLYTNDERDFTVKLIRNANLIFQGVLKPDGVYQSFVSDIWTINLQCVDGLGMLSDLSFSRPNGSIYNGKISAFDIIYNCLSRTGIELRINTYVDIFYYGMQSDINEDVLRNAKLNVDRFIKADDNTTMSCQEVLKSVLELFNACITQHNGEWFIYRAIDLYKTPQPYFKRYEINKSYMGLFNWQIAKKIGSQIDNYYPHHCNLNQRIEIKGAISAYRLNYKYGFIGSILGNGNLYHQAGTKIYEDWTVQTWTESQQTGYLIIDPVSTNGIKFKSAVYTPEQPLIRKNALVSNLDREVLEGYSFEFKTRFISYGFPTVISFTVSVGDYSLNKDGSWFNGGTLLNRIDLYIANIDEYPNGTGELVDYKWERAFSIKTEPLPVGASGNIVITMGVPVKAGYGPEPIIVEVKSIELINTFEGNNIVGEFHTVSRINPVSSIVKENGTVYNGDNLNSVYEGAIYMDDGETLTSNWYRGAYPGSEVKPILRISAEDNLRASQKPNKLFSGDLYGYAPYLCVYEINNISGKFLPVSWSFDTYNNITQMKSLELYVEEIYDIEYNKTDDYGESVKPTIVG